MILHYYDRISTAVTKYCTKQFMYTVSRAADMAEVACHFYWLSIDKIAPLLNHCCTTSSYFFGDFRGLKASVTTTRK